MGKITFVTGGARSGKSGFAEELLNGQNEVLYIATGIPFDDEMKDRIAKHKQSRNKNWGTAEAYKELDEIIKENSNNKKHILLDCITLMINNLMTLDNNVDWDAIKPQKALEIETGVHNEIKKLLKAAGDFTGQTIIVSNELGMGLVPHEPLSRLYRDIAGRANQTIAAAADDVFLVVSGIPVKIKGQ